MRPCRLPAADEVQDVQDDPKKEKNLGLVWLTRGLIYASDRQVPSWFERQLLGDLGKGNVRSGRHEP